METLTIDLINPKAKKLLKNLMDLKLINITKTETKSTLKALLEKTRKFSDEALTLEEITAEVEIVRQEMYDKKTKNNY